MPSYTKKPKVTRFKSQQTAPNRTIRVATVARRERPGTVNKGRKMRPMRRGENYA